MNLSKTSDTEILSGLEKLTKSERKITHLILWHILEVETRKLFLQAGYDSIYKYLTAHLGYSESAASVKLPTLRSHRNLLQKLKIKQPMKPKRLLPVN